MDRSYTKEVDDDIDNRNSAGPVFFVWIARDYTVSKEFQKFTTANGIRHIVSLPYHLVSNGAAERAVQVVKQTLRKHVLDIRDYEHIVDLEWADVRDDSLVCNMFINDSNMSDGIVHELAVEASQNIDIDIKEKR